VAARHYLLAYRIADMLGSGRDAVAAHWCGGGGGGAGVLDGWGVDWFRGRLSGMRREMGHCSSTRLSQNPIKTNQTNQNQPTVCPTRACAKISASPSVPDATLREQLLARLKAVPGAKFAPIAAHAQVGLELRGCS
jgi:hypothetical protein